ncbi:hypothetical protein I6A86_17895 [Clostridioides difficile]|nr:hypothetical protein [Clostridioides difficile]MBZ0937825.1 hypothetical protein [Clostridioides difficile]
MEFTNKQHKEKYEEVKQGMGFSNDTGEYASFAYILSSPIIYPKVNLILSKDYKFRGNDEVQELISPLSSSEKVLINLAVSLYTSTGGDSVLDTFTSLDKDNFEIALNSIKIRFGM